VSRRALADGFLNVALFLLLVAALTVAGWRPWRPIALVALLSCGVETAQLVIPGRDPSLSDVLFNTLGIALGVALAYSAPAVWPIHATPGRRPLDRRSAPTRAWLCSISSKAGTTRGADILRSITSHL